MSNISDRTPEQMDRIDQAIAELDKLLQERRERIAAESKKAAADAWSGT